MPIISNTTNMMLDAEFTEIEVIEAVKNMNPTKALETDGLPALFYQKYWSKVNKDVINVCLKILNENGHIACLNETLIALIAKVEKSERID